jgi:type IX secretion system PorP/SprF family membrane protein
MKKIIYLFIFFAAGIRLSAQEQPHYSFYMMRQSLVNPAALSTFDRISGAGFFNAQMVGFKGAPIVGAVDFSFPIGKTGLVIGGLIQQDKIGATYKSTIGVGVAYRIKLNPKNFLAFGINANAYMINADFNQLNVTDPADPSLGSGNSNTFWSPNFKLGAYYFRQNFYVGFAVGNILTINLPNYLNPNPTIDARFQDVHFYINAGWQKKFHQGTWKFQPSVMLKEIAGSPMQVDVNLQFLYHEAFGFGVSYRTLNTLMFQLNYTHKDRFTIAYAFNMGLGFGNRTNYTGHEVMLGFKLPQTKNRIPVDIPRF